MVNALKCSELDSSQQLPQGYNQRTMKVKNQFDLEVKHRKAERTQVLSLTQAQRYVLRELRLLFQDADEKRRGQINLLENIFRRHQSPAVNKKLNFLRRNGMAGEDLVQRLADIYTDHSLAERNVQVERAAETEDIPRVICSEALV